MNLPKTPPGPTCVAWDELTTSGGVRTHRSCWHSRSEAESYAGRWPLPQGWRYEKCTHIPAGTAEHR